MTVDADAELMLRVARGDQRAFAQLFDRYHASVSRFAFRFVGERAKSEELAQEIFFKLYRTASRYQPTAAFKTYLFRVAANHCLNEIRRGEYKAEHVESNEAEAAGLPGPSSVSPESAVEGQELERVVHQALAEMSERERAAFTLCRWEGLSYREISDALSCSEAAVKSLIHRATLTVAKKVEALERSRES
jgi:RNA polymerase sigma-70 factor, ECF subfamily